MTLCHSPLTTVFVCLQITLIYQSRTPPIFDRFYQRVPLRFPSIPPQAPCALLSNEIRILIRLVVVGETIQHSV